MNGNMHGLESPLPYEGDSAVMSIVDELVWDTLEEDMVPDVLIEVFMEAKENPDLANKTLKDAESITASMVCFYHLRIIKCDLHEKDACECVSFWKLKGK